MARVQQPCISDAKAVLSTLHFGFVVRSAHLRHDAFAQHSWPGGQTNLPLSELDTSGSNN